MTSIMGALSLTLVIAFWATLGWLVLSFLLGLTHGWRFGLYRFISFAVIAIIFLCCLGPISSMLGSIDLKSTFGVNSSFSISLPQANATITVNITSLFETLSNAIKDILVAYNVSIAPDEMVAYASALSFSIIKILVLILYGFIIFPFFLGLIWFNWVVFFKHIIPKKDRKARLRKGRIWSSFSNLAVSAVCGALIIFPLTAIVNSLNNSFQRVDETTSQKLKADGSYYTMVADALDAYNNSTFAQAFFNWTKGNSDSTFDTSLVNWLTKGDFNGLSISFVEELGGLVGLASQALATGVSPSTTQAEYVTIAATSPYVPELIRSISKSKLATMMLPYGLDIALNFDAVKSFLATNEGIDTTSDEWAKNLDVLADVYKNLQGQSVLDGIYFSDSGQLSYNYENALSILNEEENKKIQEFFTNKAGDLTLFGKLIEAWAYVTCCQEMTSGAGNDGSLAIRDFFPGIEEGYDSNGDGIPDAVSDEFKSIEWANEFKTVYNFLYGSNSIDPTFLPNLLSSFLGGNSGSSSSQTSSDPTASASSSAAAGSLDIGPFIDLIADHPEEIKGLFVGDQPIDMTTGVSTKEGETCLFDSSLIGNGLPKITTYIGKLVNDSLKITDTEKQIDLTSVVNNELHNDDVKIKKANYKTEYKALLGIVTDFCSGHPTAKALLKDFESHPGIYIDPNETFQGVDDDLIDALSAAVKNFDVSKIAKEIIPTTFDFYLNSGTTSIKNSLGLALDFDFNCDHLGSELSNLLSSFKKVQDIIPLLSSLTSGTTDTETLKRTLANLVDVEVVLEGGQKQSALACILDTFVDSKILNPDVVTNGVKVKNSNYASMINKFLSAAMGDESFAVSMDLVNSSSFDANQENEAFYGCLKSIVDTDLLSLFSAGSGSTSFILNSLNSIDDVSFIALFSSIGDSQIVSSIAGDFFDSKLGDSLFGTGSGISFSNISDWTQEGSSLKALIKAASEIGDLSNIDFFGSDPTAISNIIKALAGSQLFIAEDGSFLMPSFLSSKLTTYLASASSDVQSLLEGTSWNASTNSFVVDAANRFGILENGISSVSTPLDWTKTGGEADNWGALIRSAQNLGGFNSLSNIASLNATAISNLALSVVDCRAFSTLLTTQLYLKVVAATAGNADFNLNQANLTYIYEGSIEQRKSEISILSTMISALLDDAYGIVDASGTIGGSISLGTLDADHFLTPVLYSLSQSEVFNNLAGGRSGSTTLTCFESVLSNLLTASTLYGDPANTATKTKVSSIVASIQGDLKGTSSSEEGAAESDAAAHSLWEVEVGSISPTGSFVSGHIEEVLTAAKSAGIISSSGDFNFGVLSNLTEYFGGSDSEFENAKNSLKELLGAMNASSLLYPAMKNQLNDVVSNSSFSFQGITLKDANFNYRGSSNYESEEIDRLVDIIGGFSRVSTNFESADSTDLCALLATMAGSGILNTLNVETAATSTFFQETINAILSNDLLASRLYSSSNPKMEGKTKAEWISSLVNTNFDSSKAIVVSILADGTRSVSYKADVISAQKALLSGTPSSLDTALEALKLTLSGSSLDFDSLTADSMQSLLEAFDRCSLLYDCVPNLLSELLSGNSFASISSKVDFSLANPFFQYGDPSNYDFTARYGNQEIENLSLLVELLKDNGQAFANLSLKTAPILSYNETLRTLAESQIFNLAGPNKLSATYSDVRTKSVLPNNLTVFEQFMKVLYGDSKLCQSSFSTTYDSLYLLRNGYSYDTEAEAIEFGSLQKLYDSLIAARTQTGFWADEISHLTTSLDGSFTGLIEAVQNGGFLTDSSSAFSDVTSDLQAYSPDKLAYLMKAFNGLSLTEDALSYSFNTLINETFGFGNYDRISIAKADGEAITISEQGSVFSLEFDATSLPTLSFGENKLTENRNLVAIPSLTPTITGNHYVYDLSSYRPGKVVITAASGEKITNLSAIVDSSNFLRTDENDIESYYELHGIEAMTNVLEGFYDEANSQYFNFSSSGGLQQFLGAGNSSYVILSFLDDVNGFFARSYVEGNYTFLSRDATIASLLKFQQSGISIDLSSFIGKGGSDSATYAAFKDIFDIAQIGAKTNLLEEATWLDHRLPSIIGIDAAVMSAVSTSGEQASPILWFSLTSTANNNPLVALYDSLFTYDTLGTGNVGLHSLFGSNFIAGMSERISMTATTYAAASTHSGIVDSSLVIGSGTRGATQVFDAYSLIGDDTLMTSLVDTLKQVSKIQGTFFNGKITAASSSTEKADFASLIKELDTVAATGVSRIVACNLFNGGFYDIFVNSGFFRKAIPFLGLAEVDFPDAFATDFTTIAATVI